MRLKHKYNAVRCEYDGIMFHSKRERNRYIELNLLKKAQQILFFLRQTPFHLPGNVKYLCDFVVFWTDGNITFEDVKGFKTDEYIIKKKMVEDLYYPIKISEL